MVRINFAEVEDFSSLPYGNYHILVSDVDVKQHGDEAKHPGNDYWNIEVTVQDGELEDRKDFIMFTLPPYKPFQLVNLLRATVGQHEWSEEEVDSGEFDVEVDDILNLEAILKVAHNKKNPDFPNYRFLPYNEEEWKGDASLLP